MYAPCRPDADVALVIVDSAPVPMVIVNENGVLLPAPLVPVMLIVVEPAAVGVPVMAPEAAKVRPPGIVPVSE